MTDVLVLLIYGSLLIVSVILLVSILIKEEKTIFDYTYLLMLLCLIGWQVFEGLVFSVPDVFWAEYFYVAKYAFVAYLPIIYFVLVARFYAVERRIPRLVYGCFYLVATGFAVLSLVPSLQHVLLPDISVISLNPLTLIGHGTSIPYILLMAFTQIPIVGIAVIVLTQRRKLPAAYRSAVTILLWGLVIYVLGAVISFSGIFAYTGLNFNIFGVCLMNFLFYIAVAVNGRSDFLNVWRGDVFDYLEEAILILNNKGEIIDANYAAEGLFSKIGLPTTRLPIEEMQRQVALSGKAFMRKLEGEGRAAVSEDLYVIEGDYPRVYEVQRSEIIDASRGGNGEFIVFNDVTRNRLYIERLQDLAGVDTLTGLPNRFSFEQMLHEWDQDGSLPLSIIMGDVNGLKTLNDSVGHKAGDELLAKVSEILKRACPRNGMVARVGGDEFVLLLKNCSKEEAEALIERINQAVEEADDFPHVISIALGSATKERGTENLNALYVKADERMYARKRRAEVAK